MLTSGVAVRVTVKEQLEELLEASVAVRVTVVVPVPPTEVPGAGVCVITMAPPEEQLSVTTAIDL
jgi:hypothetical protein